MPRMSSKNKKVGQKKSTRKDLIKELDNLFREVIRKRDKVCQMCGKRENLQCAHIFSRSHFNTRWDVENGMLLCVRCHLFIAHKEPIRFAQFVEQKLGEDTLTKLKMRADTLVRGQDLQAIKVFLEFVLKNS